MRNRPNKIYNLQLQQHLSSHPLLKMETVPLQPALRPRLLLKTVAHLNFDLPLLKYIIKAISNQRLLKGSVSHAISIEKKYKERFPELDMSFRIGEVSRVKLWFGLSLDSNKKINVFYGILLLILIVLGLAMFYSKVPIPIE